MSIIEFGSAKKNIPLITTSKHKPKRVVIMCTFAVGGALKFCEKALEGEDGKST
jgi:hypothetical protein